MAVAGDKRRTSATAGAARKWLLRLGWGAALGLSAGLIAYLAATTTFLRRAELITLDLRYRIRPEVAFRADLGYIDYDDPSLVQFGAWPWSRNRQVALMKTVDLYDARAVGYDVFFLEHGDVEFNAEQVEAAARAVTEAGKNGGAAEMIEERLTRAFRDHDAAFEDAIAEAGQIYIAQAMELPDTVPTTDKALILKAILDRTDSNKALFTEEKREALEISSRFALPMTPQLEASLYKAVNVSVPLPRFGRNAAGIGFAQIIKDLDPTVRLYPLCIYYDRKAYPSIALVMLAKMMQVPMDKIRVVPGEYMELPDAVIPPENAATPPSDGSGGPVTRETVRIPIDDHCQMLTNWTGTYWKRGLHVSFLHIARFYALNCAKEIARSFPAAESDYAAIREEILRFLRPEQLLTTEENEKLASQVALAYLAEPLLRGGTPIDEIVARTGEADIAEKAALHRQTLEAVQCALAIEAGQDPPAGLGAAWIEEIRKNVAFFRAKEKMSEAAPLFFPPAVTVLQEGKPMAFSPTDLEHKIFMVGLSGVGTIDLNPMPFEEDCPMVALHTTALNTILTRQFLHFSSDAQKFGWILGLGLAAGILCGFLAPSHALLACLALAGAYSWHVYDAWAAQGRWLPWLPALIPIALCYVIAAVVRQVRATREKQQMRGIFSKMVSPKVLKLMEDNPERFSLTGERKPATTFFSSIEGFSSVIRREAPEELGTILAMYLTPASEIIMDYDGYIDKYEGHVIMADFGVPLDDPDHAWKCCYAAIEQQQDIEAFRQFVLARYGAEVTVTMGINSGYVSAGNMGSEKKMQYTVMGDAVNVSARFRPANNIYNTGIITGEAAEPYIRNHVELRMLDRLLLKGKTKPTTIYEIMGWKKDAYLETKKGKPVPESLLVRWKKCPSEKVYGYVDFWRERGAEFGVPMCGEIATFFESLLPVAETMIINGAALASGKIEGDILRVIDSLNQIRAFSEAEALSASIRKIGEPWKPRLDEWQRVVGTLQSRIQELQHEGVTVPPEIPSLPELKMVALNLSGKVQTLSENLGKTPKSKISAVPKALETIRNSLEGKSLPGNPLEVLHAKGEEYRSRVEAFYAKIAARPEEYHQMMATIGSLSPRKEQLRKLFEEAVKIHWERRWDDALNLLRQASALAPEDGPVLALIERLEGYKVEPPGPAWQGEFVQKKK